MIASDLHLDRSLPIPIYLQLKGQLQYLISTGALSSGTRLPSIRELADQLQVAPATVAQAFHELGEYGLVEFRPGVGTFVIELDREELERRPLSRLHEFVDRVIDASSAEGLDLQEVAHALAVRAPGYAALLGPRVAFIGHWPVEIDVTAFTLEHALADLGARVVPILIEDLRSDLPATLRRIGEAPVVCVPLHFAEARRILASVQATVVGITFILGREPQAQLALLADGTRMGVIVTTSELLPSFAKVVTVYGPTGPAPTAAVIDDADGVQRVLASADVIAFAMGTRARIREVVPDGFPTIELTYEPDVSSIARLRDLLSPRPRTARPVAARPRATNGHVV